jgi:hypothetical protein
MARLLAYPVSSTGLDDYLTLLLRNTCQHKGIHSIKSGVFVPGTPMSLLKKILKAWILHKNILDKGATMI